SWKDPALSVSLIAYIFQDALIKQALFPSPGPNASTKKGGGKKKVDAHWDLAKLLLDENPTYEPAITAAAADPKTRLTWANKIKTGWPRIMKKTARKHIIDLGQTGAGIKEASDVDMSRPNGFTNKWGACPAS
ncbi:hypothetical protein B0H14DRAFT_2406971, partial [Mycena olivaceomarginata]